MTEKPPSPHGLIGDHWPEIDELGIAKVATALAKAGTAAGAAEQKSYEDGNAYQALLPEGFEAQVEAAFKVGGMAADLSGWFVKCATETGVVAEGVALAKLLIAVTTMVAEAVIASKEAEIAVLQSVGLRPEIRAQRIQQLRSEIKQITDEAKQAIQELYDGIYTPTAPASPGLQPLIHNDQPFPKFEYGRIEPAGSGSEKGSTQALDNSITRGTTMPGQDPQQQAEQGANSSKTTDQPKSGGSSERGTTAPGTEQGGGTPAEGASATRGTTASPSVPGSSQPSVTSPVSAPSSGASSGASSLSSVGSSMPKMPSAPSAPSGGGLGGGSGLSGLGPGGGASASPASLNPTQQFLNGAAQGFSQSPVATGASAATAAAQPFRPPAGSTMQTSPAPLAPTAPAAATPSVSAAPQQMVASPSAPAVAGAPPMAAGAGGVPLAPPPAAGVPNAAPPPSPVAPPPAAAAPPGGGGPVSGPPPGIMNLGGKNAALKAVQMGAHTVGEGLRSTPEFSAAMALVAALNDPQRPLGSLIMGGWSCAVFGAGASMRFVVAERHGLSWIPAGVFLPAGLTVAHLDVRVPADVRYSWRGLDPSSLVLAEYAKAIGEQPRIVVARAYHPGMPGWFGRGVVLAADEGSHAIINNPLYELGGPSRCRHRLQVADAESWQFVMSLTEKEVAEEVQKVARWLVGRHDQIFEQWPEAEADAKLRAAALAQLGRKDGTEEIKALLAAKMTDVATRLIGTPNYGTPQWRVHTGMEMALRGWEALLLGLGKPSHAVLADMQYAMLMATQPILPLPAEAAAAGA
ncbi:MAG: hypothetical protein JST91_02995 [Actinobacteria bacterium]|nr:hypothetical protein [Actinomycetota bacterium]